MRHGPPVNVVENIQDVIVRERVQQAGARSPMSGHDDAPHLRQQEKESTNSKENANTWQWSTASVSVLIRLVSKENKTV